MRRRRRVLTEAIQQYRDGGTLQSVMRKHRCSYATLADALERAGVPLRTKERRVCVRCGGAKTRAPEAWECCGYSLSSKWNTPEGLAFLEKVKTLRAEGRTFREIGGEVAMSGQGVRDVMYKDLRAEYRRSPEGMKAAEEAEEADRAREEEERIARRLRMEEEFKAEEARRPAEWHAYWATHPDGEL